MLCAAGAANALTLGKARGAVLLGQPLILTIALQYEADEAVSDWCFDADVYYGDVRQEGSRVTATPVRADTGTPTGVRVAAAAPVDEPVVTVYLRSGCGFKTSRKYVLLSDLASDLSPVAPNAFVPSQSSSAVTPSVQSAKPGLADRSEKAQVVPTKPQKTAKKLKVTESLNIPQGPSTAKSAPSARPRLKVSILDLLDVKDPDLRLSGELLTLPSDDSQKRDAAKALWRSLNTSESDVLRDEIQQKAISSDLKSLRDISDKNQTDLQDLSQRLAQAESERFANPLTFLMAGLLIALVLVVVTLVVKLRKASGNDRPWWSGSEGTDEEEDDINTRELAPSSVSEAPAPTGMAIHGSITNPKKATASAPLAVDPHVPETALDIDLDLNVPMPQGTRNLSPSPHGKAGSVGVAVSSAVSTPPYQRDFTHSLNATLHAINTQEMLDVRQQADFFMTLGQHEEAINLLETSIRESEASNPLVYIDLLKVLHTLSRKPAFDHYRNEFNTIFTGWVPQYAVFGQPGNSLDAYPQICAEISQVWGSESALEFLEQCMVRSPEDAPEHYFDLDAFRDLLLLHAIAGRIGVNASGTDSGIMPFSAMRAATVSLASSVDGEKSQVDEKPASKDVTSMPPSVNAPIAELRAPATDDNLIDFDASRL